jgi:hypothetical protein
MNLFLFDIERLPGVEGGRALQIRRGRRENRKIVHRKGARDAIQERKRVILRHSRAAWIHEHGISA